MKPPLRSANPLLAATGTTHSSFWLQGLVLFFFVFFKAVYLQQLLTPQRKLIGLLKMLKLPEFVPMDGWLFCSLQPTFTPLH